MFYNYNLRNTSPQYYNPRYYKSRFNWSGLLNNTQKTLGIINQVIPICYQIGPIYRNAKTMFKVASEINRSDVKNTSSFKEAKTATNAPSFKEEQDNVPNFFI